MKLFPQETIKTRLEAILSVIGSIAESNKIEGTNKSEIISFASNLAAFMVAYNEYQSSSVPMTSRTPSAGAMLHIAQLKMLIEPLKAIGDAPSEAAVQHIANILGMFKLINDEGSPSAMIEHLCADPLEEHDITYSASTLEIEFVDGKVYVPPTPVAPAVTTFEGVEIEVEGATIDNGASKETLLDW
jgi:hypothetical protein